MTRLFAQAIVVAFVISVAAVGILYAVMHQS
jgi:hypothetical protein